jgi:hypothetical protein
MMKYEVMIPDVFIEVEADSEADAIKKAMALLANTPLDEMNALAWESGQNHG